MNTFPMQIKYTVASMQEDSFSTH